MKTPLITRYLNHLTKSLGDLAHNVKSLESRPLNWDMREGIIIKVEFAEKVRFSPLSLLTALDIEGINIDNCRVLRDRAIDLSVIITPEALPAED